jgi:hypothetical protein
LPPKNPAKIDIAAYKKQTCLLTYPLIAVASAAPHDVLALRLQATERLANSVTHPIVYLARFKESSFQIKNAPDILLPGAF